LVYAGHIEFVKKQSGTKKQNALGTMALLILTTSKSVKN
tara:strand:- start:150 stop:266 length:117 start_codon:yes stop_codon:yes gene_type:complete